MGIRVQLTEERRILEVLPQTALNCYLLSFFWGGRLERLGGAHLIVKQRIDSTSCCDAANFNSRINLKVHSCPPAVMIVFCLHISQRKQSRLLVWW